MGVLGIASFQQVSESAPESLHQALRDVDFDWLWVLYTYQGFQVIGLGSN